ncbi:MAG: Ig-like domain-containing protein, partial [Alphaproteobacteria bacterium]
MSFWWKKTILGTSGNDTIIGRSLNDLIFGKNGNDQIYGEDGNDKIWGGRDHDTIYGGNGNDKIWGGRGNDTIHGGTGNDYISGGSGNDVINGGAHSDVIYGGSGNDTVIHSVSDNLNARDYASGGRGWDTLVIEVTADQYAEINMTTLEADFASNSSWRTFDFNNYEFSFEFALRVRRFEELDFEVAPDAMNDVVMVMEDDLLNTLSGDVNVLDNDVDANPGDILMVSEVNGDAANVGIPIVGMYGTLTLLADGSYTYVVDNANPTVDSLDDGDLISETFSYTVQDTRGLTDTAILEVMVKGTNDAPVAVADMAMTTENADIMIDVLANDTDVDGDDNSSNFTLLSAMAPAELGTASIVNNQVVFNPGTDFDALDDGDTETFEIMYTMQDDSGAMSMSKIDMTVMGENDAPEAVADMAMTTENDAITIDVLANDTDVDDDDIPSNFTLLSATAPGGLGTVSVAGNQVVFNPGTDFDALDDGDTETFEIMYTMQDDSGATSTSKIDITVKGENDAPVAVADMATANEDTPIFIDVLANDTDIDEDDSPANFTLDTAAGIQGLGTLTIVGNQLHFDPGTDFDDLFVGGIDLISFEASYTMSDTSGASATGTVTITVLDVINNSPPTAASDTFMTDDTVNSGVVLLGNILANDTDSDIGDTKTVTAVNNLSITIPALLDSVGELNFVADTFTLLNDEVARFNITPTGELANEVTLGGAEMPAILSIKKNGGVELTKNNALDFINIIEDIQITFDYTMEDSFGEQSSSNVAITVDGTDNKDVFVGDDVLSDNITGDANADILLGRGGDDTLKGGAGDDTINGGGSPPTTDLSSLDGTNGFVLNGIKSFDNSGISVSAAGDINGDGIDDIIIGARNADPNGLNLAGETYVLFGKDTTIQGNSFADAVELADLDGTNGFALNGIESRDFSGTSVSAAGDINGDGIDDIII